MPNLRDEARRQWASSNDHSTLDEVRTGCLLRIADAADAMATNFQQLKRQRDMYQRWWEEGAALRRRQDRQIAALRGVITKLRKRLETKAEENYD